MSQTNNEGAIYYALDYQTKKKLCKYSSWTFTDPETRYTTHEKEVLAIVRVIEKYMFFLRPKHFTVYTNSSYAIGFRDLNLNK